MVFGNVLKNNTYPLSVSAERVFQSIEVVKFAKTLGATYIAHGSTGAGNDQVRFDMIFQTIAPEIEIITPIRDLKLSRQTEIDYLVKAWCGYELGKIEIFYQQGYLGYFSWRCGNTCLLKRALPESAYPSQLKRNDEAEVTLDI